MHIGNRSAENGGEIIDDTTERTYEEGGIPVMAYAIVETVIATITTVLASGNSDPLKPMENLDYYDTKTLAAGDFIYANIKTVKLTSGALQVFYQ